MKLILDIIRECQRERTNFYQERANDTRFNDSCGYSEAYYDVQEDLSNKDAAFHALNPDYPNGELSSLEDVLRIFIRMNYIREELIYKSNIRKIITYSGLCSTREDIRDPRNLIDEVLSLFRYEPQKFRLFVPGDLLVRDVMSSKIHRDILMHYPQHIVFSCGVPM